MAGALNKAQGDVRDATKAVSVMELPIYAQAPPLIKLRCRSALANYLDEAGRADESIVNQLQVLRLAEATGQSWRRAMALDSLAYYYHRAEQHQRAVQTQGEALREAELDPDPMLMNAIFTTRGIVHSDEADNSISLQAQTKALDYARQAGADGIRALGMGNLADVYLKQGDFSRALRMAEDALPLARKARNLNAEILARLNLGLAKMAECCPGTTYAKLAWLQAWHIRDETYGAALGELVNAQLRQPLAAHWGDGSTSSSDGQNFKTASKAQSTGHINPKYGSSPGRTFYTHISDQYAPFHTKLVNVGVRDSTYVLDGLLYHESDLRIEEHYTDTAGFTDHVFGLMHLLGFRFAPRIRDLGETRLFIPKGQASYDALGPMISGERLNVKQIRAHWGEILRLATSIKQGTVTASLMLRKLASYPRQNGLAIALRELGRIERTLFILDWLQSVELRRRVHAGLNKGEARNALARAVFFNRLGEIRDRGFEQQRYRASGLNLVTAAIVLWNTVYLERVVNALRGHDQGIDDTLLQYLSALGWEHINLTGDYLWRSSTKVGAGKFRPLRPLAKS